MTLAVLQAFQNGYFTKDKNPIKLKDFTTGGEPHEEAKKLPWQICQINDFIVGR